MNRRMFLGVTSMASSALAVARIAVLQLDDIA
jgi:hypothetical protein